MAGRRHEMGAAFVREHPGVPDLVEKQTYDRRTDRP